MKAYYKKADVEKAFDEVKAKYYRNEIICAQTKDAFAELKEKFNAMHTRMVDDTVRIDEIAVGNAFKYKGKTYLKIDMVEYPVQYDFSFGGLLIPECRVEYLPRDVKVELLEMHVDFVGFTGV